MNTPLSAYMVSLGSWGMVLGRGVWVGFGHRKHQNGVEVGFPGCATTCLSNPRQLQNVGIQDIFDKSTVVGAFGMIGQHQHGSLQSQPKAGRAAGWRDAIPGAPAPAACFMMFVTPLERDDRSPGVRMRLRGFNPVGCLGVATRVQLCRYVHARCMQQPEKLRVLVLVLLLLFLSKRDRCV